MIRNYIFDFDGTLMDTAPVILGTMQATIREMGLPARTESACRATIGLVLEEIPRVLFPEQGEIGKEYAAVYRRLFPQYNLPGVAQPFPHVSETLEQLRQKGCGMAIASSRSHASLVEFVNNLHLQDTFQMLVAGDDVKHAKPNPEPVLLVLNAMGWKAEETLVVGDAGYDLRMGRAAGALTCGVTYGNGTLRELQQETPDYLVDSFKQILTF